MVKSLQRVLYSIQHGDSINVSQTTLMREGKPRIYGTFPKYFLKIYQL